MNTEQVTHLIIAVLLICSWLTSEISMYMSYLRVIGHQSSWCPHGSNHFAVPQRRCLPQMSKCYLWHMPSFEDYRKTSRRSCEVSLLAFLLISNLVSLMCTQNSAIIIISMTNHHSILGQHVCHWFDRHIWFSIDEVLVLDPCIAYEGMKFDYKDNEMLSEYLESSKQNLYEYYEMHYAGKHSMHSQGTNLVTMPAISHNTLASPCSPQKDFTLCLQQKEKVAINELDEFFKLPQEHFGACNPIHW